MALHGTIRHSLHRFIINHVACSKCSCVFYDMNLNHTSIRVKTKVRQQRVRHLGGDEQHLVGTFAGDVGGALVQGSPAGSIPAWAAGSGMQAHQPDSCLAQHGVACQVRLPQHPPHLLTACAFYRSTISQQAHVLTGCRRYFADMYQLTASIC